MAVPAVTRVFGLLHALVARLQLLGLASTTSCEGLPGHTSVGFAEAVIIVPTFAVVVMSMLSVSLQPSLDVTCTWRYILPGMPLVSVPDVCILCTNEESSHVY